MEAAIKSIEYYLPRTVVSNSDLAGQFNDWTADKIEEKTGISSRHIAAENECSSDLAVAAAEKLFASGICTAHHIDYILLCTQSPDYFLPTTACLVQQRLGVRKTAGAFDFNLGCSGFVYGLGMAKGLIETNQARCVLLITAETYSKFMHPEDKSVRTLFGDAAAATLVQAIEPAKNSAPSIGPFVFGTDGSGGCNLIVPVGGLRRPRGAQALEVVTDRSGNKRSAANLFMNGPEIFAFTLREVPGAVHALLDRAGRRLDDIDLFIFHQANEFMLEHLRKKLEIPKEKFHIAMRFCGNTVSSTIPIALKHAIESGIVRGGMHIMLVGFGVGYSWGATLIRWLE